MIEERLDEHVEGLCKRNLRSKRVKCCAKCPFEDDIVERYPDLQEQFDAKRTAISLGNSSSPKVQ